VRIVCVAVCLGQLVSGFIVGSWFRGSLCVANTKRFCICVHCLQQEVEIHSGFLQCVAVCCSVLQCVAVCCSVLQCVAVCCSMLQCVALQREVKIHCLVSHR